MLAALMLFAQEAAKDGNGGPSLLNSPLLPMLLMFGGLFVFIILPNQRREKKQREELMAGLKKNDEVLTTSGIIGVITNVREGEDEVTVKIDDNCKVRMKKTGIVQVLKSKETKDAKEEPAK